jgi:Ca-activated chloride channel homolog
VAHLNSYQKNLFMKFLALIIGLILTPSVSGNAQSAHKSLRQGDADFAKGDFKKSEENYRRALEAERSSKASYNLGNAIYNQKRYDEAIQQYEDVAKKTSDKSLKGNSLYNQGNAHFWKKDYAKSIEAYKNALRLNPQDEDAKKNLALAQRFQKKEEEEKKKQQQQNKDDKNKDNKDDKNKNDKDKQPQNPNDKDPNKDKNPQDKDKKQPNQPDQNPKQNPQEQAQQDLKKEEAKRMLQIMDDEERKVQQRLKKGTPRPSRSAKDW